MKRIRIFPSLKGLPCTVRGCEGIREESLTNYCPTHTLDFLRKVSPERASDYVKRHPELAEAHHVV